MCNGRVGRKTLRNWLKYVKDLIQDISWNFVYNWKDFRLKQGSKSEPLDQYASAKPTELSAIYLSDECHRSVLSRLQLESKISYYLSLS